MQPPLASDDPFLEIEKYAKRQAAEEKADKAIRGARARMVLATEARTVFFATAALQLEMKPDWDQPTMATDGTSLFYNPDWTNSLGSDEQLGVVVHEVMHNIFDHQNRREGRDPETYNEAGDLSINSIIEEAGFKLPKCRLMPGEGKYKDLPKGKSTEEYYNLLKQKKQDQAQQPGGNQPASGKGQNQQPTGQGNGQPDPGGCGAVMDAGDPAEQAQNEAKWKVIVAQAEQASRSRGSLPGGLARLVDKVINPPADWRDVLREFVTKRAKNGRSWNRPNRRFIGQGLYLPGRFSRRLGKVKVAIDTSGSIGKTELDIFANELQAIVGAYDCSLDILYHDSTICKTQTWEPSDGPLELSPAGGGGTSHVPVFENVENDPDPPVCVVCLTDLYTEFPSAHPTVPTLWAVIGGNTSKPPFGQVVKIQ